MKIVPEITVAVTARLVDGIWDTDVTLNGEPVGGGTSPHGFLDTAGNILYGDKNSWLNGSHGALGDLLHGAQPRQRRSDTK